MEPWYWIGTGLGVFLLGELMSHVFGKKQEQVKTMEQSAQADVAAALQQAIDRLHQSVPARPAAPVQSSPPVVTPDPAPSAAPSAPSQPSPAATAPAPAPVVQSISPPPDVKVDKGGTPIATTQAPPPVATLPPGNQADRERVMAAKAFGYGSPPWKALAARAVEAHLSVQDLQNQYAGSGPDTDPDFNKSHASPRDYGYTWNGAAWESPANPVGGNWNPTTQRFE